MSYNVRLFSKASRWLTRHWMCGYLIYYFRKSRNRLIWTPSFKVFIALLLLSVISLFIRLRNIQALIIQYDTRYPDSSRNHCYIPRLDPQDETIRGYFREFHAQDCRGNRFDYDLIYIDRAGVARYNRSVLARLPRQPVCEFSILQRVGDDNVTYAKPELLDLPRTVPCDFFRVDCTISRYLVFSRVFSTIYPRPSSQGANKRSSTTTRRRKDFNVLIFCLDSLSRVIGARKLPRTHDFLTNVLHSVQFNGYTQVWDNTYGNLIPLLTGLSQGENPSRDLPFDTFDLIWKAYEKRGYVTLFSEERPTSLGLFNYAGAGFLSPPVDHYMRPFWLALEKEHPIKMTVSPVLLAFEHAFRLFPSSLCYKGASNVQMLNDYTVGLFRRYLHTPKFAFVLNMSPGHDHMNMVQVLDDDVHDLLQTLHSEGHLDDTVVVFMGDHGHRFDLIRHTLIGQMEQRSPYLSVSLPVAFRQEGRYRELFTRFKDNRDRLTTHYDVHETLMDLLNGQFTDSSAMLPQVRSSKRRGVSLFRPISPERTCVEASIPAPFCACFMSNSVDPQTVRHIADFVIRTLNELSLPRRSVCKELTLREILDASVKTPGQSLLDLDTTNKFLFHSPVKQIFEYYVLSFFTDQSDHMLNSTVRYDLDTSAMYLVADYREVSKSACFS